MSSCFHRLISLFVAVIAAFVASCTAVPSIPRQKTVHIPHQALTDALQFDIESQNTDTPVDWISLLAFLAATYGNDFSGYQKSDLQAIRNRFTNGESMETLKFSPDYYETFSSVLKAYAGPFYRQSKNPIDSDSPLWNAGYGLRAFFPIAEGFRYFHDNNPVSTGHRLFCNDGTPIIAIEGGTIEKITPDNCGGQQLGIRSFDQKRYYDYVHLSPDTFSQNPLQQGSVVLAGDVIGYLKKTNCKCASMPHLFIGIHVDNIRIDTHQIITFLEKNKSAVIKDGNEYRRKYQLYIPQ